MQTSCGSGIYSVESWLLMREYRWDMHYFEQYFLCCISIWVRILPVLAKVERPVDTQLAEAYYANTV